jgi:hypothetical protein
MYLAYSPKASNELYLRKYWHNMKKLKILLKHKEYRWLVFIQQLQLMYCTDNYAHFLHRFYLAVFFSPANFRPQTYKTDTDFLTTIYTKRRSLQSFHSIQDRLE